MLWLTWLTDSIFAGAQISMVTMAKGFRSFVFSFHSIYCENYLHVVKEAKTLRITVYYLISHSLFMT